jgi:UDP-N-acetylglucosamine 4,6-dehydratase/5-epimerase
MCVDYLIIGGTGSLGRALINKIIYSDSNVAVYSRDEAKHWTIKNELVNAHSSSSQTEYRKHKDIKEQVKFYVGDIRDKNRIKSIIQQCMPKVIIIAAALKQVDTCELSPGESVFTNLTGTQNVIDAINEMNSTSVETVLFVSTDKACSPVNVYGMCKAISERVVTNQSKTGNSNIRYLAVRYGNVLESRGSIIPLFKFQVESSNEITVTDPEMTRFIMTLEQSVDLIFDAINLGSSGETWIPFLPAMKIGDLADLFAEKYEKAITVVGQRPGEKMHEELLNESESSRSKFININNKKRYILDPSYVVGSYGNFSYSSSANVISKDDLKKLLEKYKIFEKPLSAFKGREIEEIIK